MKTVKFDKLTGEQLKQLLEQKQTGGEVNTVPEVLALFEGIPDNTTLEDWVAQQIDTSPDMENLRRAMAQLAAMEEEINGHEQERISNETQREEQSSSDHQRAEEDHTVQRMITALPHPTTTTRRSASSTSSTVRRLNNSVLRPLQAMNSASKL